MSAECGLPNFNTSDAELFWSVYPALKKKGLLLKGCSHPALFENDPCTAWGFYGCRYEVEYPLKYCTYENSCAPPSSAITR
jgi:hypothetical protein